MANGVNVKNDIPNFNLLAVFAQVMEQGSLSKAADHLNTNQSTISTMLVRLKEEVGQELFIRKGRGVVPTRYSTHLYQQIQDPIQHLNSIFTSFGHFDPDSSQHKFIITAPEHLQWLLLNKFETIVNKNLSLEVFDQADSDENLYEALLMQKYDLMIDTFPLKQANIESIKLFESEFVVICRQDHPRIQGSLSKQQYLQESHAILERTRNHMHSLNHYTELDLTHRKVAYHGRSLFSNVLLISQTNYVSVVPLTLALQFKEQLKLQVFQPPFEYKKFSNHLIWLKKHNHDPAHIWLRNKLINICNDLSHDITTHFSS